MVALFPCTIMVNHLTLTIHYKIHSLVPTFQVGTQTDDIHSHSGEWERENIYFLRLILGNSGGIVI